MYQLPGRFQSVEFLQCYTLVPCIYFLRNDGEKDMEFQEDV